MPPPQQARLEVLTNALQHLARKGLTAAAVIANFHRQRMIPITERNLPIFDLTPDAPCAGSRTSYMLLPDNPEDLWKIKMRPETGYLSVVSSSFNSLSICATPLPTP